MAELADALDSGSSIVKDVQVQLLLSAPDKNADIDTASVNTGVLILCPESLLYIASCSH